MKTFSENLNFEISSQKVVINVYLVYFYMIPLLCCKNVVPDCRYTFREIDISKGSVSGINYLNLFQ